MCEAVIQRQWPQRKHKVFKFENMTVTTPPLLKIYYWEFFGIDKLNERIAEDETFIEHTVEMPPRQLNSSPLKIVLWLRNLSEDKLELEVKRRQNCTCEPVQTRVGFNQFRQLYHCPHRRLVHVVQDRTFIDPGELVALRVIFYYYLFGENTLTYEIRTNDDRIFMLHFKMQVLDFSPAEYVLTKELLPINMHEFRRFVQPIWVFNLSTYNIGLNYSTRERGLKLLNPNFVIPALCVWPLMVEYRPSDVQNELEIKLKIDGSRKNYSIQAEGTLTDIPPDPYVPLEDIPCTDYPFSIFPNKIELEMQRMELRTRTVAVHNDGQTCLEFRWQPYSISDLFDVTFDPKCFRLKPHHTKLCLVIVHVHDCPLNFKRVPLALEVHRILDKSTRIAKELLEEVESIDDPKFKEHSYMLHMFIQLNIKVHFKVQQTVKLHWEPPLPKKECRTLTKEPTTTVFEKFFWEYLSESTYMRANTNPKVSNELTYNDVIRKTLHPIESSYNQPELDRNNIFRQLSEILVECLHHLAQHWQFVPIDYSISKRHSPTKKGKETKCQGEEKKAKGEEKGHEEDKRHVTIIAGKDNSDVAAEHEEGKKGNGKEKKGK